MMFCPDSRRPLIAAALAAAALLCPARAEITIAPLRHVLDEQRATATFVLSNPSQRIVEGRVGWTDLAATADGYRRATPEEREKLSAAPFLIVRPASFRLEPGKRITITVETKKGARIPFGERRSHLLVETRAVRTPLRKAGGALELDIGLGVSTPVILRRGQGAARAAIGETRLLRSSEGLLELQTAILPQGSFSAWGRIELRLTAQGETAARTVGRLDNVAAWRDAPSRLATVPIEAERLPEGVLEIVYLGAGEYEGVVFARRIFDLAGPG